MGGGGWCYSVFRVVSHTCVCVRAACVGCTCAVVQRCAHVSVLVRFASASWPYARACRCVWQVPYPTCACVSVARTELQWWRVSVGHCQCARVHTSVLESPETVGGFGETEKLTVGRETIELSWHRSTARQTRATYRCRYTLRDRLNKHTHTHTGRTRSRGVYSVDVVSLSLLHAHWCTRTGGVHSVDIVCF